MNKPSTNKLQKVLATLLTVAALFAGQNAWAQNPQTIGSISYNSTLGAYEINSVANLNDLAVYVNGTGTYSDGITIETTAHDCNNKTFKMTGNIAFQPTTAWNDTTSTEDNFTAIGNDSNPFKGSFNGDGHTISGIRIYKPTDSYQGLFGKVGGSTGSIQNVTLTDARITGKINVGGIVGYIDSSNNSVSDCHVTSTVAIHAVVSQATMHGGIAGINSGTVSGCTSAATVSVAYGLTGCNNYGGIVGRNFGGTVSNCLAICATVDGNNYAGAIVGSNTSSLTTNYYRNCIVNGNTTNVGTNNGDIIEGARGIGILTTTTTSVTATGETEGTVVIDNTTYHYGGQTITFTYSGEIPEGHFLGVVTANGGTIEVTAAGNDTYTFTMPAEDITAGTVITWSGLQTLLTNASTDEENPTLITLNNDVVAASTDSRLLVTYNKHVIIDLNGYAIDRHLSEPTSEGEVILVRGNRSSSDGPGYLTIRDSSNPSTGRITGGYAQYLCGGVQVVGFFTLESGSICGNKTNGRAAGVYVNTNTTGGKGTFTMTGGSITNNTSYSNSNVASTIETYPTGTTFNMSGGTISGNHGGQWAIEIKNNFNLSGTYDISGNTKNDNTAACDIYCNNSSRITITDPISPVHPSTVGTSQTVLTNGWSTHMGSTDPATCFTPFESNKALVVADGELTIVEAHTLTVPEGITVSGLTPVSANTYKVGYSDVVTLCAPTGYAITSATLTYGGNDYPIEPVYGVYSFTMPAADATVTAILEAQSYTLTVEPFENLEIITFVDDEVVMEGDGEIQVAFGSQVMLSIVADEGYVIETLMVNGENHADDIEEDFTYTFEMPDKNVTISATAVEAPTPVGGDYYVRITSLDQLTDGSIVVIAARYDEEHTNKYYAMSNTTSGKPTGELFTSTTSGDNEILPASIVDEEYDYYWVVNETENGYTFTNAEGSLIGYSTSTSTNFATDGDNTEWSIELSTSEKDAMVPNYTGFFITNVNNQARHFALNSSHNFGPYHDNNINTSGYNFCLDFFVQSEAPVTETYTLDIAAHSGEDEPVSGWYLIASPVADAITPTEENGFLANEYDLYRFNQAPTANSDGEYLEWENWKQTGDHHHFNIVSGRGYLYANSEDVTLTFVGMPYSGDGSFTLEWSDSNPDENMRGWNLVGNPFAETAYIDRDFYRMNYGEGNTGGNEIIVAESNAIAPMEGIFVYVSQEENGETVLFSTQEPGKGRAPKPEPEQIVLNLSNDRGSIIDRAIVNFGEGGALPKFQLFGNSTKVYIPQGGKDYAVVSVDNMGEIPVHFKAEENGTYTLTVSSTLNSQLTPSNAPHFSTLNYLHLTDNMTGADVDLLSAGNRGASPAMATEGVSYTFTAKTTDYESRFKLVFSICGDANGDNDGDNEAPFAFINNGNIIVNGTGMLQVVDVMGRVVCQGDAMKCKFGGANRVSTGGMTAGVYVLRLVNGNDVRTQKIVIE